jgi:hypothetical protein
MFVKVLGILDIFSALIFVLFFFSIMPFSFVIFSAAYLVLKGVIFLISKNLISILDILSGAVMLLSFLFPKSWLIWLVSAYLIQKGIFSLL